jgi:hypothetical protein
VRLVSDRAQRTAVPCGWCGRPVDQPGQVGRPRRYCCQACRQRAYEQRREVQRHGLPADAVVLTSGEVADLADRLFQLRCAAEDLLTALAEGARAGELEPIGRQIADTARTLERLRGGPSGR